VEGGGGWRRRVAKRERERSPEEQTNCSVKQTHRQSRATHMQPATHANQSTPTLSDPPMHLQRINPRTMQRTEMMSATVAAGAGKYTGRVVVDTTLMPEGEGTALWVHRDPDTRGRGHSGLTVVQYSGGWSDGARHGDGAWKTSSGARCVCVTTSHPSTVVEPRE
jgi:hypothetical protein